jgi:hypothetical protein
MGSRTIFFCDRCGEENTHDHLEPLRLEYYHGRAACVRTFRVCCSCMEQVAAAIDAVMPFSLTKEASRDA